MNILMLVPQYRPIVGGYERAAERLSKALACRGHRVVVLAERRLPTWPGLEQDGAIEIRRWWCIYRPRFHTATSLFALLWALLRFGHRFDVWHLHQYGSHAALAIALSRLMRRPTVLKLTSSSHGGIREALHAGPLSRVMTALHRQASAIAAPSRETFAEARRFGYPDAQVFMIPNGVDTARFIPTDDAERKRRKALLGLDCCPTVIAVSRFVADKNLDGLLYAWAHAQASLRERWRLILVGDGPIRTELEHLAIRLGLRECVRFAGHQHNVEDWLACADLFVQASHREGLSNTMLEAMATGLPIVITAVSGAQECVGETGAGIVVPVGDTDGLAAALVSLAHDQGARAKCGAMARREVERAFGIERVAEKCESVYQALVP